MFTAADISALIGYGTSESAQAPERFNDAKRTWRTLMCGDRPWLEAAESLDRADLAALIKGLVLLGSGPVGSAGSVSPVIPLYRVFRERFPSEEPDLTAWVVDHRANPYEPFGTPRFNEARSYPAFMLAHETIDAAHRHRLAEQQAVAAARRAEDATTKLPDAIRRGDVIAVEALLAKGADTEEAAAMAGMPLSALASKEGRTAVMMVLTERGIP